MSNLTEIKSHHYYPYKTSIDYEFYHPYPSTRPQKKFMVLTNQHGKIRWIHFGDSKYEHYTEGHLDEKRRSNYIHRNEDRDKARNDFNTAGFWALHYLWMYKTYKQAYEHIRKMILKKTLK